MTQNSAKSSKRRLEPLSSLIPIIDDRLYRKLAATLRREAWTLMLTCLFRRPLRKRAGVSVLASLERGNVPSLLDTSAKAFVSLVTLFSICLPSYLLSYNTMLHLRYVRPCER